MWSFCKFGILVIEFQEKLEKELNYLREQLEHQLDGYSLIKENSHLKTEVNRLMTANCLANIQANEKRVCMLEAKYNELKTEQSQEGDGKTLSRLMGKPTICICENKDADQLRGNREADQRLCFRYSNSTFLLLLNSEISSF